MPGPDAPCLDSWASGQGLEGSVFAAMLSMAPVLRCLVLALHPSCGGPLSLTQLSRCVKLWDQHCSKVRHRCLATGQHDLRVAPLLGWHTPVADGQGSTP